MLKPISEELTMHYVDAKLRRSRQVAILKLISETKLAPQDFKWEYVESPAYRQFGGEKPGVSALIHSPTGSYFIFDVADRHNLGTVSLVPQLIIVSPPKP